MPLTVADLRRDLAEAPDDMIVMIYDEGYLTEADGGWVCLLKEHPGGMRLKQLRPDNQDWTEADGARPYFLIT